MEFVIFAGKGGVGKSTSAASYAINASVNENVLLIDYDGGHSLIRVLGLDKEEIPENTIQKTETNNLNISVIDQIEFETIAKTKYLEKSVEEYLIQFPGDYGIIPYCDMATSFFGLPTDVHQVSKFTTLVNIYHRAIQENIQRIVIDVEPTAGLERLLNNSTAMARSLLNLKKTGKIALTALGTKWPDIKLYIKGEYIKNSEIYSDRMLNTAKALKSAKYFIVTIPESSPVDQVKDVWKIIRKYGGSISGFVINNIRGETYEEAQIQRVLDLAKHKPIIRICHDLNLCDSNPSGRMVALKNVGKLFENSAANI